MVRCTSMVSVLSGSASSGFLSRPRTVGNAVKVGRALALLFGVLFWARTFARTICLIIILTLIIRGTWILRLDALEVLHVLEVVAFAADTCAQRLLRNSHCLSRLKMEMQEQPPLVPIHVVEGVESSLPQNIFILEISNAASCIKETLHYVPFSSQYQVLSQLQIVISATLYTHIFFPRPTPLGFRQVVPHVQLHVA